MPKMTNIILVGTVADALSTGKYVWTDAAFSPIDNDFLINDTAGPYLFHNYTLDNNITKKVTKR